jgi:replicative DNA helicase
VTEQEQVYLHNAVAELAQLHLTLDDSVATMSEIHRRTRRLASRGPLGLVVVDYIQLLHLGRGKANENWVREVAEVSRQMKLMAREFNVPVLALSQLSRPEKKYDTGGKAPKPTLASLRDSGALEQDADMVWFLHRQDEVSPEVELIVAKNRSGPTGKVMLHFVPHLVSFYEL